MFKCLIYLYVCYIDNNRECMPNALMRVETHSTLLQGVSLSRTRLVIYYTQTWSSWCSFLVSFLLRCSYLCIMNINVEATNRVNGLLSITCMLEV